MTGCVQMILTHQFSKAGKGQSGDAVEMESDDNKKKTNWKGFCFSTLGFLIEIQTGHVFRRSMR